MPLRDTCLAFIGIPSDNFQEIFIFIYEQIIIVLNDNFFSETPPFKSTLFNFYLPSLCIELNLLTNSTVLRINLLLLHTIVCSKKSSKSVHIDLST